MGTLNMGESMADEQNKRWLVTLNLNNTSFVLEEELIDKDFQRENTNCMIWGIGSTREDAVKNAVDSLLVDDVLHCSLSDSDLCDFVENHGGREAVIHSWFDDDGDPHLLPYGDVLADFCKRHNLSQAARLELSNLFSLSWKRGDTPDMFLPSPGKNSG